MWDAAAPVRDADNEVLSSRINLKYLSQKSKELSQRIISKVELISKNNVGHPLTTWELEARTMETGGREEPLRFGLLSIVALAAFFSNSGKM